MLMRRQLWDDTLLRPQLAALLGADSTPRDILQWQPDDTPGNWWCEVELGTIPAGHLVVPSLIPTSAPLSGYRMSFRWPGAVLDLAPIAVHGDPEALTAWPAADTGTPGPPGARAQAGLDCMETLDTLNDARLRIELEGPTAPPRLPLLVSIRPRHIRVQDPCPESAAHSVPVPAYSQMTQPAEFARHCCSPVSVAMVLTTLGQAPDLTEFVLGCRHPRHRLFGIWPLNLARAARHGAGGAVRTFSDAADALAVLRAGSPIIASIRFETGALTGAPLPRTGGHLVVLHGLDAEYAWVNDPAAPSTATVTRKYPRAQFLRAWLADRGVGYVLWDWDEHQQP